MKQAVVGAASSLFATAIGYVGLNVFAESLGVPLKLAVAGVIGACAFGIAVWATGESPKDQPRSAHVASNLKGASARIENVRAETVSGQNVEVASNIDTQGPIEIKDASIDSARDRK